MKFRRRGKVWIRPTIDHSIPVFKNMAWDDACKHSRSGLSIFFIYSSSATGAGIAIGWTALWIAFLMQCSIVARIHALPLSRRAFPAQLNVVRYPDERTDTVRIWRGLPIVSNEACQQVTQASVLLAWNARLQDWWRIFCFCS